MTFIMSLNELKKKLLIVYHNFLNVFDKEKTTQLLLHQSYNHKIELEKESQFSRSWLYFMLSYKLQKIKEYLKENLKKKFITLSKASFASSILFVEKKDNSLQFCVNYQKLNALIKKDRYSILLINEVLAQIQDSKYLTQLNIIITFNKLCMSSESEDLTTFITFFNVYKYKVMLFELINESAFFQHYINDVLFNCLHKFCQTYLNDILIYNKTLKEHRTHVKEVLEKLREVDLQINIDKCKFKIQKISFLELLIFINDLQMNSQKVDVIQDWKVSWSLTHVQIFIDFCNFYRWFIKNFSKITWFMIKLTWKDHLFEWTEICQTIFEELKQQVMTVFILKYFNLIREVILKTDFSNMSTTKYCLRIMMKTFYIQWSFIARTWFSQNVTMRFMTRNCWLSFAAWSIDALNWKVWIFQLRSSSIIWIWSTSWSSKNWSDDKLNELKNYLNITSRLYISWKNRIWKSTCWSECQTSSQLKQMMIISYISIRCYCQKTDLNFN